MTTISIAPGRRTPLRSHALVVHRERALRRGRRVGMALAMAAAAALIVVPAGPAHGVPIPGPVTIEGARYLAAFLGLSAALVAAAAMTAVFWRHLADAMAAPDVPARVRPPRPARQRPRAGRR